MRRRIREDPEVRRSQIVDEAIRIVGERGYYGFTVEALAQRCGISNAGLLYYFGSKDSLLLTLLDEIERREEEYMAPLLSLVEERVRTKRDRMRAIVTVVRAMVERVAAAPEQARFVAMLQGESLEATHPAHRWFAQREAETIALFVRLLEPLCPAPRPLARALLSVLYGLLQQWLRSGRNFDLIQECEEATQVLVENARRRLRSGREADQ